MQIADVLFSANTPLQITFVDLLLGGDNALIIALASRSCRPEQVPRVVLLGTCGAIALRLLLATVTSYLLLVPYLRLIGALFLLAISLNVVAQYRPSPAADPDVSPDLAVEQSRALWSAVLIIVVGDAAMSLDNILAITAIANGNTIYLALGLLISIPMVIYGSLIILSIFTAYPALLMIGAAFLAWVAGSMAVSEPALADWINSQSPALAVAVPAVCALFIIGQAWDIFAEDKSASAALVRQAAVIQSARHIAAAPTTPRPSQTLSKKAMPVSLQVPSILASNTAGAAEEPAAARPNLPDMTPMRHPWGPIVAGLALLGALAFIILMHRI